MDASSALVFDTNLWMTEGFEQSAPTGLVSAASGLAADYLNIFNEIIMIIEQLPTMPELAEDLLRWRSVSYRDYFARSNLPDRLSALMGYEGLDSRFRMEFETVIEELDSMATGSVVTIRRFLRQKGMRYPKELTSICQHAGIGLRAVLARAVNIINEGSQRAQENAQRRADRLLAVRLKLMEEKERYVGAEDRSVL